MSYRLRIDHLRDAARKRGDATGYAIAKRAGLPVSVAYRMIKGERMPDLSTLMRLSEAYGLSVEALVEKTEAA